jgi:histidinol dehydrogenase
MKILENPSAEQWENLLARPVQKDPEIEGRVFALITEIREQGWEKVAELTLKFDKYDPDPARVPLNVINEASGRVPEELKASIALAAANIRKFHEAQRRSEEPVQVSRGINCYRKWVPIEKVGLYVPGGSAPLISTVLMLAIPAQIAGCREIILCTPGNPEGKVNDAILYAASFCGIEKVYRLGGAQAIAAMAYGAGPVPKVDKIFGPGNSYVTLAKQIVSRDGVAIDMPAGPSEVAVIADETADPSFIAADLLSQAEHGPDSQVLLVSRSRKVIESVVDEIGIQLQDLPRKEIAARSLENSLGVVMGDDQSAMDLVNYYAPEHLIINTRNFTELAIKVIHAGSVFLGLYTPESAGDYASGTNHTLPTSGFAKAYSGLSLDSFMKTITFQELTPEGLGSIGETITTLARAESLEAHARAVDVRSPVTRPASRVPRHESSVPRPGLPVRPNIAALSPYSSARDEFTGQASVYLDANENPVDTGINRYPDPHQKELKSLVAGLKGVQPNQVFLGNGSDEAIDLLIRIFCEPGRSRILMPVPTYGMYSVCAGVQDVAVDTCLLNGDFTLDIDALLEKIRFDTRIIFLCSPNNPTGNQIGLEDIRSIAENFSGIVALDEAYIDFASGPSALSILEELPNLVVLQTFSKAWGMAGARVGMAFARPEIISLMDKVKYPYNINTLSMNLVIDRLRKSGGVNGDIQREVDEILRQREYLKEQLSRVPGVLRIYPSEANFLLVKVTNAKEMYKSLAQEGIIVRDRSSQPLCENCLRITVGTEEQNLALLNFVNRES